MKRSGPLKRKTPMKRSTKGFSKTPAKVWRALERSVPKIGDLRELGAAARPLGVIRRIDPRALPEVRPKHDYVRSETLMRAYRMIPCQNCFANDGTVCGAHANWGEFHKGMGVKADDNRCASLCWKCHAVIDQGMTLSETEKKLAWSIAHARTVALLCSLGLWPADVPIPDIPHYPF